MERLAKVATPLVVVWVRVPERVPLAGLVPMARVMAVLLSVVTVLPRLSSTLTWTAGVMVAPAVVVVGWVVNTSWEAAPGVMVKALLVAVGWVGVLVAVRV